MSTEESTAGRKAGVQSVDRALDVLEVLATQGGSSISEVVRATGLAYGTAHRLLATLAERGYVRQGADRRYAVGAAALRLVDPSREGIAQAGTPFTRKLAAQFEESANLAVLQGNQMVYVAQTPSPHSLRIFAEVGRHVPLHSTAVGKAVLATYDDDAAAALLATATLDHPTAHTLSDIPSLLAEFARIRERGFGFDEQEQELGVRCVAAAVPNGDRPSYAALSISGPAERFTLERAQKAGAAVASVARALAAELG